MDDRHFRIFTSIANRSRAGFRQVIGIPVVVPDWTDFLDTATDCGELLESSEYGLSTHGSQYGMFNPL